MAGDRQGTRITVFLHHVMIVDHGLRIVGLDGVHQEAGMHALKAVPLIVHLATLVQPGNRVFHPVPVGLEGSDGRPPSDPFPDEALHQRQLWVQQIILVVSPEQDEVFLHRAGQLAHRAEHLKGIRSPVKQVAQEDQPVVPDELDFFEQGVKRLAAAVNIPDDDVSHICVAPSVRVIRPFSIWKV